MIYLLPLETVAMFQFRIVIPSARLCEKAFLVLRLGSARTANQCDFEYLADRPEHRRRVVGYFSHSLAVECTGRKECKLITKARPSRRSFTLLARSLRGSLLGLQSVVDFPRCIGRVGRWRGPDFE
jgi:hypothetical protein